MHAGLRHLSMDALEAGLDKIRNSPADQGVLRLIVRRPRTGEREILEQGQLDPATFWRVHRSHLVNINRIKEIVPWFSRNYILRMKDAKATEIPVSRSQTKRLREYLRL